MPYIRSETRKAIDHAIIDANLQYQRLSRGEMNYLITRLVHNWVEANRAPFTAPDYELLSNGHSILQDAAAEFYRKVLGPYEDDKIALNGAISVLDGG